MSEHAEGLSKKLIWTLVKIPIVSLVLLVLVASAPLPIIRSGIDCYCQYCELVAWYDSIGVERLWFNIRTIVPALF